MSNSAAESGDHSSGEVVPVELFFDLVFAFALSQLSHHLLGHVTRRGSAQTAVLLCAVFGVWAYTSFQATVLGPERRHAQRALLAVMFAGLVMNAAISHAFTDGAWSFVIPLLACQYGYAALTMRTATQPGLRAHYRRVLIWFTATTPLWVVGATSEPRWRLAW